MGQNNAHSTGAHDGFTQSDISKWSLSAYYALIADGSRQQAEITNSAIDRLADRLADKVADAIIAKLESPLRVTQDDIRKFAPELLKGGKHEC